MRLPELYAAAPNSDQDWKSRIAERQLEDTELARDPRILQLKLKGTPSPARQRTARRFPLQQRLA